MKNRLQLIAEIYRLRGRVVPHDLPADTLFEVADAVRRDAAGQSPDPRVPEIPEEQLWPLGRKATVFLLGLN